jgi:hypothetical protein
VAIIQTYIENSCIPCNLTATDIITLREHAVPDELTTALVKRGATLRTQAAAWTGKGNAVSFVDYGGSRRSRFLDPESYEYSQYY